MQLQVASLQRHNLPQTHTRALMYLERLRPEYHLSLTFQTCTNEQGLHLLCKDLVTAVLK